jgi:hypothetical protein
MNKRKVCEIYTHSEDDSETVMDGGDHGLIPEDFVFSPDPVEPVPEPVPVPEPILMRGCLAIFDVTMRLGLFLTGSDVLNLACTSAEMREASEALMLALWKWCPRIQVITRGSLSADQAFQSFLDMTCRGRIIPMSKRCWDDILTCRRDQDELSIHTKHTHFWLDDEAQGLLVRWFQVVYGGFVIRNTEVFNELAVLEMLMSDLMATKIPSVFNEAPVYIHRMTTRTHCGSAHAEEFMVRRREEAAEWAFTQIQCYVEGTILIVKGPHTLLPNLKVGLTYALRVRGDDAVTMVEEYREFMRLRVRCNQLDKLAIKAIRKCYEEGQERDLTTVELLD